VPGTSAHSWQEVAADGMSIGKNGMIVAAKPIAAIGIDLINDSAIVAAAKKEFEKARGDDFEYIPVLGDREPAMDYREGVK